LVSIHDLDMNLLVDSEAHLDLERVERFTIVLDELSPVVVFDTPEGLLLADGYHRVRAAERLGRVTVEADVRRGSRSDALRYAAAVAATERGITEAEAIEHIKKRSGDRWA
jgi:hypothetical protein